MSLAHCLASGHLLISSQLSALQVFWHNIILSMSAGMCHMWRAHHDQISARVVCYKTINWWLWRGHGTHWSWLRLLTAEWVTSEVFVSCWLFTWERGERWPLVSPVSWACNVLFTVTCNDARHTWETRDGYYLVLRYWLMTHTPVACR